MALDDLIRFYHELSPESLARLPEFYSEMAYFKDPFNEVRGVGAIQGIFRHMFRQLAEPRFIITGRISDANGAMLIWKLHGRSRRGRKSELLVISGVSHLKFDADGRVRYHRDFWDTAEELYMKLPLIGSVLRGLRRALAA